MSEKHNHPKNYTGEKALDLIARILTPENIQVYILGTKRNGRPRAVYDIIRDRTVKTGGKKKKKKAKVDRYSLYLDPVRKKKKGKKKKKKSKYWNWNG